MLSSFKTCFLSKSRIKNKVPFVWQQFNGFHGEWKAEERIMYSWKMEAIALARTHFSTKRKQSGLTQLLSQINNLPRAHKEGGLGLKPKLSKEAPPHLVQLTSQDTTSPLGVLRGGLLREKVTKPVSQTKEASEEYVDALVHALAVGLGRQQFMNLIPKVRNSQCDDARFVDQRRNKLLKNKGPWILPWFASFMQGKASELEMLKKTAYEPIPKNLEIPNRVELLLKIRRMRQVRKQTKKPKKPKSSSKKKMDKYLKTKMNIEAKLQIENMSEEEWETARSLAHFLACSLPPKLHSDLYQHLEELASRDIFSFRFGMDIWSMGNRSINLFREYKGRQAARKLNEFLNENVNTTEQLKQARKALLSEKEHDHNWELLMTLMKENLIPLQEKLLRMSIFKQGPYNLEDITKKINLANPSSPTPSKKKRKEKQIMTSVKVRVPLSTLPIDQTVPRTTLKEYTFLSQEEAQRMVFVHDLPPNTHEKEMKKSFAPCGQVEKVMLFNINPKMPPPEQMVAKKEKRKRKQDTSWRKLPQLWTPTYAFLTFADRQGAMEACEIPLQVFGVVIRGYQCRTRPATRCKSLFLDMGAKNRTQTIAIAERLNTLLGSCAEVSVPGDHEAHVIPQTCKMGFNSFSGAFKVFEMMQDLQSLKIDWINNKIKFIEYEDDNFGLKTNLSGHFI